MITCVANSDTSTGPEVPFWECPCKECYWLEQALVTNDVTYRPGDFPTYDTWKAERLST